MPFSVKICGLSEPATLRAALDAGADIVGLVSFSKSPRHVSPARAAELAALARGRARIAVLTVDAEDDLLAELYAATRPDIIQLHGHERPERARDIRQIFGVEVWKAIPVSAPDDLIAAEPYFATTDRVLFDARPPKGADLPGGNGVAFDWDLLANLDPARPFVLSGGLTPENVGEAVRIARASAVDVSSGVESAPGVKDPDRIAAFVSAARTAGSSGFRDQAS